MVRRTDYDYFANRVAYDGTTPSDVHQWINGCWVMSALVAAADAGIDLQSRITYLGNGEYQVKLLNPGGPAYDQQVPLGGGRKSHEPHPVEREEPGEILVSPGSAQRPAVERGDAPGRPG